MSADLVAALRRLFDSLDVDCLSWAQVQALADVRALYEAATEQPRRAAP